MQSPAPPTIETKYAVSLWADGICIDQTMVKSTRGATRAVRGLATTRKEVDDIPPSPIRSEVRELACAGSEMTDSLISHANTGLDPVSIEDLTSEVLAVTVEERKWPSCVVFCDGCRWFSWLWVVQGIGLALSSHLFARLSRSVGTAWAGFHASFPVEDKIWGGADCGLVSGGGWAWRLG